MESYQPPARFMRPPPAPPTMAADPHLPPPPPPPSGSWFSGQFQFHPSHSPSPPPSSQHNQWGPPPPPPPPYHAPPYPPPQPYPAPPPPPPHYSQLNQDWGHANWTHYSGWEYPARTNEDDWAARARAWASARSTMENPLQSQFASMVRREEASQYSSQYSQHVENHYHDIQETITSTPGFQNYQVPIPPRASLVHAQDPPAISSYALDGHFSFAAKDEAPGRDVSASVSHHQGSTSSLVNQLEVPSSYPSVPGKEGLEGQQHGYSLLPADSRSMPLEQAQFAYGNHSLDPMDQPLEFTPRFGHENNRNVKSSYPDSLGPTIRADSATPVSSLHAWTDSVTASVSYPPITPAFPSAPQHDSSIGAPPLAGQSAPMFGRGSGFQPAAPAIGSPICLGAGSALHPTTAFTVDAYGASLGTERPKKAAVPNWLREEIIKNKAAITNSTPEQFKEGIQSMEDVSIDKPIGEGDQVDSKSMDSSRSTEEDDDEDYEEAQKTAAINQEVKRIVTEVLLKVTDELFDEIATRVLGEDDLTTDGIPSHDNLASDHKVSPPPPVPAPTSAKVLVAVIAKESETEDASGESSSGSAGNVLGLVNYASDDEDNNENQISSVPKSDSSGGRNGHRPLEAEEHCKSPVNAEGDLFNGKSTGAQSGHVALDFKSNDHRLNGKDLDNGGVHQPYSRTAAAKKGNSVADDGKSLVKSDAKSRDDSGKTASSRADLPAEKHGLRNTSEDSQKRDTTGHDKLDITRITSGRQIMKKIEGRMEREDEEEEIHGRRDGRHQKKDNTEDHNSLKDRLRDQAAKHREKTRESDPRKRSPLRDTRDDKKERVRAKKTSGRDDVDKKRERAKDEKVDKSRHKSSDESRYRRRHSSPIGNRAKRNKETRLLSDGSSDEASEDSRSKVHSKRCDLSPSPIRARRRQVSRSPSKRTQRRHSPYSCFDGSRGRRSRSRSPVRRGRYD